MEKSVWEEFYPDFDEDPLEAIALYLGGPFLIIVAFAILFIAHEAACAGIILLIGIILLLVTVHRWVIVPSQKQRSMEAQYGVQMVRQPQYQYSHIQTLGAPASSPPQGYDQRYRQNERRVSERQVYFPMRHDVCQWCGTTYSPGYPYCVRCGRPAQHPQAIEVEWK